MTIDDDTLLPKTGVELHVDHHLISWRQSETFYEASVISMGPL